MESELCLDTLLDPSLSPGVLKHEMKALLPRDVCYVLARERAVGCSSAEVFCPLQMM